MVFNSRLVDKLQKVSVEFFWFVFKEIEANVMFNVPIIWNLHVLDFITKDKLLSFFFVLEELQGIMMMLKVGFARWKLENISVLLSVFSWWNENM